MKTKPTTISKTGKKLLQVAAAQDKAIAKVAGRSPVKHRGTSDDEMRRYTVQFAIVREVTIEAFDDLNAERVAYQTLRPNDQNDAIAIKVLEAKDGLGATGGTTVEAFKFIREKFSSIDPSWVG